MPRAFTLTELLALLAAGSAAALTLAAVADDPRESARKTACLSNLKQLSVAGMNYAMDFKDIMATFGWRAQLTPNDPAPAHDAPAGAKPSDDLAATTLEAIRTLERVSKNLPGPFKAPATPAGWAPHVEFSHHILYDYLMQDIADPTSACPADVAALTVKETIKTAPPTDIWGYASSYSLTTAAFTPERFSKGGSFRPGSHQREYVFVQGAPGPASGYRLGRRRISMVAFPSMKVERYESVARHSNPGPVFYSHPEASVALSMYDGAVFFKKCSDANPGGFWLEDGKQEKPATVTFAPEHAPKDVLWPGDAPKSQPARFAFTLRALQGVDFGGPEPK